MVCGLWQILHVVIMHVKIKPMSKPWPNTRHMSFGICASAIQAPVQWLKHKITVLAHQQVWNNIHFTSVMTVQTRRSTKHSVTKLKLNPPNSQLAFTSTIVLWILPMTLLMHTLHRKILNASLHHAKVIHLTSLYKIVTLICALSFLHGSKIPLSTSHTMSSLNTNWTQEYVKCDLTKVVNSASP